MFSMLYIFRYNKSTIISSPLKACMLFSIFKINFFWWVWIFKVVWHRKIWDLFWRARRATVPCFFSYNFLTVVFAKIVELFFLIFFVYLFFPRFFFFTTSLLTYTFYTYIKDLFMASRVCQPEGKIHKAQLCTVG